MTNQKIGALLNAQIGKELYSSYLYLAMANYYEKENLAGFANWFAVQAHEELDHALLFRTYLINDGAHVVFEPLGAPPADFKDFEIPLAAAYDHEKMITASIASIYDEALKSKDFKTTQFLDWFVKEQGEEEKNSLDLIKKFDMFGNDAKGLYLLNTELAARIYNPPSLVL